MTGVQIRRDLETDRYSKIPAPPREKKQRDLQIDRYRNKAVKRHSKMTAIDKPRAEPWKESSLRASEGTSPADTLVSDLQPPEPGDKTFLEFKTPGLWCFVRAALGNLHSHHEKCLNGSLGKTFPSTSDNRIPSTNC